MVTALGAVNDHARLALQALLLLSLKSCLWRKLWFASCVCSGAYMINWV
jgi:hypothetical protein